jgi:hypothetical protein
MLFCRKHLHFISFPFFIPALLLSFTLPLSHFSLHRHSIPSSFLPSQFSFCLSLFLMPFSLYLFICSPSTYSAMLNVLKAANWEFDALQNRVSNEKLHASSLAGKRSHYYTNDEIDKNGHWLNYIWLIILTTLMRQSGLLTIPGTFSSILFKSSCPNAQNCSQVFMCHLWCKKMFVHNCVYVQKL